MPLLTLCLIARDEEKMLPGCLASVRSAVDEIVLVDTGSRDRTIEIARRAGARVLEQPWADDFSAPRKFPTFSTGHDELLLCEAIQKSAQSRSWTRLNWD